MSIAVCILLAYLAGAVWFSFVVSMLNERRWWIPMIWPLMMFVLIIFGVKEREYI